MRHPSLLGNKQPQALSELVGRAQVSVGWERGAVLGSLPGAPFISLRLWTPAGICGSPWVTLRVTVAAPGVCTLVGGGLWQSVCLSHVSLCPVGSPSSAVPSAGPKCCQADQTLQHRLVFLSDQAFVCRQWCKGKREGVGEISRQDQDDN